MYNIYIYIYIYTYIYIFACKKIYKMCLQGFLNGFLKIRWKETDKCYLLITNDKYLGIHIGESIIESSDCEKLLGSKINSKLPFWLSCWISI